LHNPFRIKQANGARHLKNKQTLCNSCSAAVGTSDILNSISANFSDTLLEDFTRVRFFFFFFFLGTLSVFLFSDSASFCEIFRLLKNFLRMMLKKPNEEEMRNTEVPVASSDN
jgi:hypothetical protein